MVEADALPRVQEAVVAAPGRAGNGIVAARLVAYDAVVPAVLRFGLRALSGLRASNARLGALTIVGPAPVDDRQADLAGVASVPVCTVANALHVHAGPVVTAIDIQARVQRVT